MFFIGDILWIISLFQFGQYRVPRINQFDLDDIPAEFRALLTVNFPPRYDEDVDGWFDYFQREIANYKQGFRRVIQDLIQLRDQHKTLTAANTDLKVKVDNFEKKKKVLSDIVQGDQMDKAKIQEIFSSWIDIKSRKINKQQKYNCYLHI